MDHKKSYEGVRGEKKNKIPSKLLSITHYRPNKKLSQGKKISISRVPKKFSACSKIPNPLPYATRRSRTRCKNWTHQSQPAKQPVFLPTLRSRARVVKVWSNEGETTSFQGLSPTRVGERTWERGREWDWGVWAPGASRENVTLLNRFWEKTDCFAVQVQLLVFFYYYLGVRGVLDRMLPFFFTDLPDVTGPSMLSGTKHRIRRKRDIKEKRSETSQTINFRNFSLNPTFCPKWEASVNVGLGEGQVGSFPETHDPKYFSFSKISMLGQIGGEIRHCYAPMTPYKSF